MINNHLGASDPTQQREDHRPPTTVEVITSGATESEEQVQ